MWHNNPCIDRKSSGSGWGVVGDREGGEELDEI